MPISLRSRLTALATAGLAVASLAALVTVGVVESASASAGTMSVSVPAPGYLHVVTPLAGTADQTPYLADAAGRHVILQGDAAVGLQDVAYPGANGGKAIFPVSPTAYAGTCPKASSLIPQPPLCEVQASKSAYAQSTAPGSGDDFAQMRALGFNLVRLVLNWSQLEPTPGTYSPTYLNRVAQVVGWARQQGIYVILDMHQDQYSRYILPSTAKKLPAGCTPSGGSDGAPKWAVFTDGKPGCAAFGEDELNLASGAAFYNFWHNHVVSAPKGQSPGTGLEDHYIGALAALAKRFSSSSTVLGYELMNEPQPGSLSSVPVENLYQSSSQDLYPFYKRAIEALTGVRDGLPTCPASQPTGTDCAYPKLANVSRQQIFYEPLAYRNLVDFTPQVSTPFSSYQNLVYAPHIYTHAFTFDTLFGYPLGTSPFPPSYEFGYQTAEYEAQAMHSAVITTEYGAASNTDSQILANETAAQDATQTGGTIWAWKGLSVKPGTCWCVRWQQSSYQTTSDGTKGKGNPNSQPSKYDQLIASRQTYLARVSPRAVAGTLLDYQYNPGPKSFVVVATSASAVTVGKRAQETAVYIPSTVHGAVVAAGASTLDAIVAAPDGSRTAYVAPTGGGAYWVTVGTISATQLQAAKQAGAAPPAPISEVSARQTAEAALTAAENSSNATYRSNAQLVSGLANLLLGPTDPNATAPAS